MFFFLSLQRPRDFSATLKSSNSVIFLFSDTTHGARLNHVIKGWMDERWEMNAVVLLNSVPSLLIIGTEFQQRNLKFSHASQNGEPENEKVSFYLISNEILTCHMGMKGCFVGCFCDILY